MTNYWRRLDTRPNDRKGLRFPNLQTLILITLGFITLGLALNIAGIRFVGGDSVPKGVYRVQWTVQPQKGEYALVTLPRAWWSYAIERRYVDDTWDGDPIELVKKIAAVAGDHVEVTDEGVLVNGELLEDSEPLTEDSYGRPVERCDLNRLLKTGEVFAFSGYDARSWDSRYFSVLATSDVLGVATPLVTQPEKKEPKS